MSLVIGENTKKSDKIINIKNRAQLFQVEFNNRSAMEQAQKAIRILNPVFISRFLE